MPEYVIAVPSHKRSSVIAQKTLKTLKNADIPRERIFIFVANRSQERLYTDVVPEDMYNCVVIGKLGIARQRGFISQFFPEGQYIVSMDDDVEGVLLLQGVPKSGTERLVPICNLHGFFMCAYDGLRSEGLCLWGVYPVKNPRFMSRKVTTDLRFVIGVLFGYINRHDADLKLSPKSESKEDYEMTLLHYLKDGGVLRFNGVSVKTTFNAEGGLGKDRSSMNEAAATHLERKYPEFVTVFQRASGMHEVRLRLVPRRRREV